MRLYDYEAFVDEMWHGQPPEYTMASFVGEVGEFYNNYKKLNWPEAHTHNPGSPLKTKSELGDMLYYFVRICHEHNTTLGDVMEGNVRKLKERHARNTNVPKSS